MKRLFMHKRKYLIIILFIISAIFVDLLSTYQLGDNGDAKFKWVTHTHEVIIETKTLLGAMQDLETGQRGYLLTQDEKYLKPYHQGLLNLDNSFKRLKSLTLDNPKQQNRLKLIKTSINLKIDELASTISLLQAHQQEKAIHLVKQDIGKAYMDDIRLKLNAFIIEEEKLLVQRQKELNELTKFNVLLVKLLISLLLFILFIFIYRTLNQKYELEYANKKSIDALKSKSEFLANMSHEIRTPLNAILGFIHLIKEETQETKTLEYLNIVADSSNSLLHIIEDILDFSKIESGKLDIDKINFNTKEEFDVITHLFDAKCSAKDITLSLDIDESLPTYLNTDPFRIKQVLSNLISNAIKFTEPTKKISVGMSYKNDSLHIYVKDEGKGIDKDKQKHIFKAFAQEDSSTTRSYGGTGLGLSISNDLVKLLGGELKVESDLGKGSVFSFHVPAQIVSSAQTQKRIAKELKLEGKILLVEDNKTNQLLMQIMIEELGLTYDLANDGFEAIEKFKDNVYDAILMDENMPNMGGMEATSKILAIEKEKGLKHTPIVALTANALKGDREKFLNAGMDEYRTKPLDKDTLSEVLHIVLKEKFTTS